MVANAPALQRAAMLVALTFLAGLGACSTNPVTGKQQLIIVPPSQAAAMGAQAFQQIKSKKRVSRDPRFVNPTVRVATRIVQASDLRNKNCEIAVFQDSSPNAFALPGCKIGVHTGLFKVAKNDAQLAAVIGHEVAHVVGRHASERVSRAQLANLGISVAGATGGAATAQVLAQAATLGLILPFSRSQESEADDLGLIYMARAGYDPRQAITLWQNFAKAGGSRPPEFLSTHPAPGNRIARLQSQMPRALAIYNRNRRR